MTQKELRTWCRKHYPFAQRSGWAYKAWLKVLRAYFDPQAARPVRRVEPSPADLEARGQRRLFQ